MLSRSQLETISRLLAHLDTTFTDPGRDKGAYTLWPVLAEHPARTNPEIGIVYFYPGSSTPEYLGRIEQDEVVADSWRFIAATPEEWETFEQTQRYIRKQKKDES